MDINKSSQTLDQSDYDIVSSSIKKPNLTISIVLSVLALLVIGGSVSVSKILNQKEALLTIEKKQISNLNQVEKNYDQILNLYKSSSSSLISKEILASVSSQNPKLFKNKLDAVNENVLGLEDNKWVQQMRDLGEIIFKTKNIITDIKSNNDTTYKIINSLPIRIVLKDQDETIDKTKTFTDNTEPFLDYMYKYNNLEIKSFAMGYEIGQAINEAILRYGDNDSLSNLKSKIDKLNEAESEYNALNNSKLPEEVLKLHKEMMTEYSDMKQVFTNIVISIENKNALDLQKSLQSLMLHANSSSNSGQINAVSLWQNDPTAKSINSVNSAWQNLYKRTQQVLF